MSVIIDLTGRAGSQSKRNRPNSNGDSDINVYDFNVFDFNGILSSDFNPIGDKSGRVTAMTDKTGRVGSQTDKTGRLNTQTDKQKSSSGLYGSSLTYGDASITYGGYPL